MFSEYLGNKIIPTTAENILTQPKPLTRRDSAQGIKTPVVVPTIFYSATMNVNSGTLYIKLVNTLGKKQPVKINLNGITKILPNATMVVIKSDKPEDTNTLTDPEKIIPVTTQIKGIAPIFTRSLDPYSVSIFQLKIAK
jgi:alpha-N-arabinofuranosidase